VPTVATAMQYIQACTHHQICRSNRAVGAPPTSTALTHGRRRRRRETFASNFGIASAFKIGKQRVTISESLMSALQVDV